MQIWMAVFSLIWIFGVIALLIYSIVSYEKIKRKLQTATRVEANVFETDSIGTAFVCGFIRPKIYVPANIGDANLSYILEHERTHIRRKDYLVKPIAFLLLILRWFNPLMWLCFALLSRDMEMSCDESVLRKLGDSAKGGYFSSLLSLSVKRKGLLAANSLAFGESDIKSRIENILNFKKPAFWVIVVAVMAVCTAAIAFAANPKDKGTGGLEKITDFAWEVINQDIANYESNPEVHIIDSKIIRLELLETFDGLADAPIDVYALEYRLLPEDLSKVVLAGGMQIDEDGWLKETSSMGSPLLVVSRNSGSAEFIGKLWKAGMIENGSLEPSIKDLLKAKDENAIAKLVEENLFVIMSSPKSEDINIAQKYKEEIKIEFDTDVKSGNKTIIIEPSQVIKESPELIEKEKQRNEDFLKPAASLFNTVLDITPEEEVEN